MRILKAALLSLVAVGCVAFACTPGREDDTDVTAVSPAPAAQVLDENGYVVRPWSPLTPQQVRIINEGRRRGGVAKGEIPGF